MVRPSILVLAALAVISASAQEIRLSRAGLVYSIEGTVRLDDRRLGVAPGRNTFVPQKSELRSESGTATVVLTPGAILHLGANSVMRLVDNRVLRPHVELPSGSFQLECVETGHGGRISLSLLNTLIVIEEKGQYRFDADGGRLTVVEGEMNVRFDGKSLTVRRGETVVIGEKTQAEPVEPVRVLF